MQDRFELSLEQGSRGLGAKLVDGVEPGSELGLIRPGAEEEIGRERASARGLQAGQVHNGAGVLGDVGEVPLLSSGPGR